uniref:Uncharacterized protein n=1 Tax=Anopheles atroparvus TaxID=41427 RepID=A0AAG5DAW7_ANOAO
MRRDTVLLGCALLIFAGANLGEAHGHGQASVESLLAHDLSSHEGPGDNFNNDLARNFHSPRLEYNEWLPVGRGDPLKNDPTYDYSPPVLDRVRYWSEGGSKEKAAGNDILLLGVPSKKVSKDWNSVPPVARRNYYSAPNQLPTVLMPPPLGNYIGGPDSGAGFWGGSSAAASQRVDSQPGEGFKYRQTSGNSFPLQGTQYQGM